MIELHDASAIDAMVNCRALELLEFQGDEREARYELLKDKDYWTALHAGMPMSDALDMSEKVGQWTLDLVGRITATGGGRGGRA
jgi:hypothetical protein